MSFSSGFRWPSLEYDQPVRFDKNAFPQHRWAVQEDLSDNRFCSLCGVAFSPENEDADCNTFPER